MINNSGSYAVDRGFVSLDLSMFELFGCFITLGATKQLMAWAPVINDVFALDGSRHSNSYLVCGGERLLNSRHNLSLSSATKSC